VVIGSGVIAIVANFMRSTALCLMAARGVEINGFWHDATAYAGLGITALALFGACLLLSPKAASPTDGPADPAAGPPDRPSAPE